MEQIAFVCVRCNFPWYESDLDDLDKDENGKSKCPCESDLSTDHLIWFREDELSTKEL